MAESAWLHMLGAMAALLLLWCLIFLVFVGWGLAVLRLRRQSVVDLEGLLLAFWIGICLALFALTCWHFFLPVGRQAIIAWVFGGMLGWYLAGPQPLLRGLQSLRGNRTVAMGLLLLAILTSNHLLQQKAFSDTGLYYLQAIQWNQEFPLVPGLGNLHGRLAYNNNNFLLQAVVLQGPWREVAYGAINGLLGLVVVLQSLICFSRLAASRSASVLCDTLGVLLVLPIIVGLREPYFRLSPESAAVAMQMAALFYACRFLLEPQAADVVAEDAPGHAGHDTRSVDLLLAVALLTGAVCVTLSSAPLALTLTLALATSSWFLARRPQAAVPRATVFHAVLVAAATMVPWCARGVVLSGYPFYPNTTVSVDVPWAMDGESIRAYEKIIADQSRMGQAPLEEGQGWLGTWFYQNANAPLRMHLPLGLTFIAGAWLVSRPRDIRLRRRETAVLGFISLATAFALSVWFLNAPFTRLAYHLFYLMLAVVLTMAMLTGKRDVAAGDVSRRLGWLGVVILITLLLPPRRPESESGFARIPVAEVTHVAGIDGTQYVTPVKDLRAWWAALPSAPKPQHVRLIRLRREGDLSSGFERLSRPEPQVVVDRPAAGATVESRPGRNVPRHSTAPKDETAGLRPPQDVVHHAAGETDRTAGSSARTGVVRQLTYEANETAKSPPGPNVLFIVVDDLRPELGCYGKEYIVSPNIDRLATGGLLFTRAYCQQATCNPSRTSVLLGMRPDSTGVDGNQQHFRDTVGPHVVTLAEHFRNNGILSVGLGKVFHTGLEDPGSWDTYERCATIPWVHPDNRRFTGRIKPGVTQPSEIAGVTYGPPYEWSEQPESEYSDGRTAEEALRQLAHLKGNRFFLAVGFRKPHLPFIAPKKYWDLYDPAKIQLSPITDWPRHSPHAAHSPSGELRYYAGIPPLGKVPRAEAINLIHGYRACVSFVDHCVGRILGELDRLGLADNTIVVLWGDHGFKLSEYAEWCKHTNYEVDTRVPLIIRSPGMSAIGARTDAIVELVDLFPTLCELADLPLPGQLEGASFAPLLEQPNQPWKPAAFSQFPRHDVTGYAMRTDRYRLVRWVDPDDPNRDTKFLELYDHKLDPHETYNLAAAPEYAELAAQLDARCRYGWGITQPAPVAGKAATLSR